MLKNILLIATISIYANASNPVSLQYIDLKVKHTYSNNKEETYTIQREINEKCLNIANSPESFEDKNFLSSVPNECKKTLLSTSGVIQPLYINDKIKTLGEIEVLDFIHNKSSKDSNSYALVDTRKALWFNLETIPGSINVPLEDLVYDEDFEDEFMKAYSNLGIKVLNAKKNIFDFSNAKTVVFFCNGPWCPISGKAINHLLDIGYPASKMMWYRGGLSVWSSLSLSVTKKMK